MILLEEIFSFILSRKNALGILLLIGSIIGVSQAFYKFFRFRSTFVEGLAHFSSITVNERERNGEKEKFMMVNFEFVSNGQVYQLYEESTLLSEVDLANTVALFSNPVVSRKVFFNKDNPEECYFWYHEDMQSGEVQHLVFGLIAFIVMGIIGSWLLVSLNKD